MDSGRGRVWHLIVATAGSPATIRRCAVPLLLIDAILAVALFRQLDLQGGLLAYGDLHGVYTYPPVNSTFVWQLNLYYWIQASIALVTGPFIAQNATYVGSLFLPSFGLVWIASWLRVRVSTAIVAAVAFGTPVDPILTQNFLNGSLELAPLLFLSLVSMGFILRARHTHELSLNLALAGVFWGIAIVTTTDVQFQITATLMSGFLIAPLLLMVLLEEASLGKWWVSLRGVLGCLAATLVVSLPVWANTAAQYLQVTGKSGQLSTVTAFAVGNAQYTFRQYGIANALLNAPVVITSSGVWTAAPDLPWMLFVSLVLAGAVLVAVRQKAAHRPIIITQLCQYVVLVLAISGISSGTLLPVYSAVPALGFIDNPTYLIYLEAVLLACLFLTSVEQLASLLARRLRISRRQVAGSKGTQDYVALLVLPSRGSDRKRAYAVAMVTFVVLASLSCLVLAPNLAGSQLNDSVYTAGESPYAGPYFLSLHQWFVSTASSDSSDILFLPDSSNSISQVSAFIPTSSLWYIPYKANLLDPSINVSQFEMIMNYLASDELQSFQHALTLQGVHYVVIDLDYQSLTLVPTYLNSTGLSISTIQAEAALNGTAGLTETWSTSHFVIFSNLGVGVSDGAYPGLVSLHGNTAGNSLITRGAISSPLPGNGSAAFANWGHWPTSGVYWNGNNSVAMTVASTRSVPYSLMYDSMNLTQLRNISSTVSGNTTVSFDPSTFSTNYTFQVRAEVPFGVELQVLLFLYNSSNDPPLYSQYAVETLATATNEMLNLTIPFSPDPQAAFARFYLYSFLSPGSPITSSVVYVYSANVSQSVFPIALASDSESLIDETSALVQQGLVSDQSPWLFGPFAIYQSGYFGTGVFIIPAAVVDAAGSGKFELSQSDVSGGSQVPLSGIFAIAVKSASCSRVNLTQLPEGLVDSAMVCGGSETMTFKLSSSTTSLQISIQGSAELSYLGWVSTSAETPQQNLQIPLVLASMVVRPTGGGVMLTRVVATGPTGVLGTLATVSGYVPLIAVGSVGVILLSRKWLPRFTRRGGLKSHEGNDVVWTTPPPRVKG